MSVRSAISSERTHRIWHAQRLLSRRPSASGPRRVWLGDMALEFNMCVTIAKKFEMKRDGIHKILRFVGGTAQFNRAAESANAIFLAAFGKILFDIATIDQNIFAVTIALVKFRLRQRAFNRARHDRF